MPKPPLYQTAHQSKVVWLWRYMRTDTSLGSQQSQGQLRTLHPPAGSECRGIRTPTPSGNPWQLPAHLTACPERQSMTGPSTTAGVAAATRAWLGSHRRGSHRVQPCTTGEHRQVDTQQAALKGKELRKLAGL